MDRLQKYFLYLREESRALPEGDIIGKTLFGRYKTIADKLCLIMSRSRGATTINKEDVTIAILLNEIFRIKTYKFLVANAVSTLEDNMNRVVRYLKKRPEKKASRTELNRGVKGFSRIGSKQMNELAEKLEEMNYIKKFNIKNKEIWQLLDEPADDSAYIYADKLLEILFPKKDN